MTTKVMAPGINYPKDHLCEDVSKKSGIALEEVKKIIDAFVDVFLVKFKMK